MNDRVDLLCDVCGEEFLVSVEVYSANSCVVHCPCCGATDLVLLGFAKHSARRVDETAA